MNRGAPIIVLLFALAFFFYTERSNYFAPDNGETGQSVVRLWAASTPAQTMAELKGEFEELHPDLRLEIQTVAWQSLQEKTLWAVAANSNVPDLVVGSSEWTGGLVNNGALEPLDELLGGDEFFSQYFPAALGTYQFPEVWRDRPTIRGSKRQYGIPLDLDMMLIFYRTDAVDPVLQRLGMEEFPTEWEGFKKLGAELHRGYGRRADSPNLLYLDPEDPVPLRMAFLPSSGGMLFNEALTEATFDEPEAAEAFSYFATLLNNGTARMWTRSTMGDPFDLIKQGKVMGQIAGPWFAKVLETRAPEQAGRWRVAPFPSREPHLPTCGLGGSCLIMPYNAPNRDGAVKLAKFMATNRFAMAYFRRVGSPPPQISAWDSPLLDERMPYFGGQRVYQVVRRVIEESRPLQLLPNAEVVKSHVRMALQDIVQGAPVQPVLDKAVAEANRILQQR